MNYYKIRFSNTGIFSTQFHSLIYRKAKTEKLTSDKPILSSESQSYYIEVLIKP